MRSVSSSMRVRTCCPESVKVRCARSASTQPSLSECRDSPKNVLRTLSVLQCGGQLRQAVGFSRPKTSEQIEVGTAGSLGPSGSDMGIVTRHPEREDGRFQVNHGRGWSERGEPMTTSLVGFDVGLRICRFLAACGREASILRILR
jgi:hypothetical protein